ncbi:mitochondrial, Pentatricopeptide repeat-containing protein 1 [Lucilia cuprina]|nr:mitochondrial, Pentatricopeptide repeat-containing protein 1 [Lucilia cuprina]
MFTRLRACTDLYRISKHVLVTQQFRASAKYYRFESPRFLHVKTYDKDAGLEAQRAANKNSHLEAEEIDRDKPELPKVRRRRQNVRKELFNVSSDVLKTKEVLKSHETDIALDAKDVDISKDDPDVFGDAPKEPLKEDEGDLQEEEYITRPTRRSKKLRTKEYAIMIKEHFNNHRVKEALEVLEVRMLKEDRVKPENYIYNLLISGCAKAGYTRKAFNLYTKMRQRGLKVKESTYTSLFNACANAPSRQDGLTRAIRLRQSLLESGYEFNVKNYNSMIKTFGRWGDVKTAYILADEMRDKKLPMTGETFNILLQACASDEKHGFRHCLLTWHKMLQKNIEPDYYSFNAVLRCVRDCGFGDLEEMEKVLQLILSETPAKQLTAKTTTITKISTNEIESTSSTTPKKEDEEDNTNKVSLNTTSTDKALQIQSEATSLELPNLLAAQPHLGSMVSLSEVQKPHERFLLLGGLTGFLELLKSKNITPDIQTFTTMLEVIPPTNTAEKQLLTYIRKIGLKADIDFFNILIKKRAMRFDYEGGKEVLSMIRTAGLYPDIVTYGVLALGCTTVESSRELLEQMRHNSIRMNIQILGAMLRQGCAQKSFPYICEIMQISLDENIKPNEIFLRHLNNFYLQCARAIDARHPTTKNKLYKKEHKKFCDKYRLYQEEHGIDGLKLEDAIKKIKERPYDHYKEQDGEGIEPIKNEKLAKKTKLRKYIKKIKIQNLKGDEQLAAQNTQLLNSTTEETNNEDIGDKQQTKQSNPNNPFRIA